MLRKIDNLDLWILSLDSRGINVWCAARGNNFGNRQLIEAVNATEIRDLTTKKVLILPQLSAGGIAIPQLPKKSSEFPFKVKFGPIWAKYVPEYLRDLPSKKPDYMKHIDFSLSHRMRAGFTHSTFLLRKIFLIPILLLSIILMGTNGVNKLWIIGDFIAAIIISNYLIAILFPISKFTRRFIIKGFLFGLINTIVLVILTYLLHQSLFFTIINIALYFWLTFFSTMSFSGYSFATGPREIGVEYPFFRIINYVSLIIGLVLSIIGVIFI